MRSKSRWANWSAAGSILAVPQSYTQNIHTIRFLRGSPAVQQQAKVVRGCLMAGLGRLPVRGLGLLRLASLL